MNVKITVITVCLNADKTIKETLESILKQTMTSFEYIIIDGKSNDMTLDIINQYLPKFCKRGIDVRLVSEKDNGIYDAMNKAAKIATGEWVVFINADDQLYSEDTLAQAIAYLDDNSDIVYGDTLCKGANEEYIYGLECSKMTKRLPFVSQSAFVRTSIQNEYKFNTEYRYGADYDMFLRTYLDGKRYKKIDEVVAVFGLGGASMTNSIKCYDEAINIKHNNGVINKNSILQKAKIIFKHARYRIRVLRKK